jgi:hypothetical protein
VIAVKVSKMSDFSNYPPPVSGPQGPLWPSADSGEQKNTQELAQALNNLAGQGPPQSILEQLQADPQLAHEPSLISHFLSVADHIKQSMQNVQDGPQSIKTKGVIEDLQDLCRTPVGGPQGKSLNDVMDQPTNDNAQAYLEGLSSPQSSDWAKEIMAPRMQDMSAKLNKSI